MDKHFTFKINLARNTLTLNYKCARMANVHDSVEYHKVREILAENPGMKLVVEAGRKAKTPHHSRRLTYKNMEKHIWCYPNAEELLAAFETAKSKSKVVASPYAYVVDWFQAQFPNYKDGKACVTASTAEIVPLPDVEDYKKKSEDMERAG